MAVVQSEPTHEHEQTNNHPVSRDDDDHSVKCGFGGFSLRVMRRCASMPVFVAVYSLSALTTTTLGFYVGSQVTTLERQFGFTSGQSGFIVAANDVGFLTVVLFASFMAHKVHIPRALGFCTILYGVSGIVCALPHFLFGAPGPTTPSGGEAANGSSLESALSSRSLQGQLCDGFNHSSFSCDLTNASRTEEGSDVRGTSGQVNADTALVILVGGMMLQGVAKAPRSSFTAVYVDRGAKVKTGFYIGIITAMAIVGPALAFGLGSVFSQIYVTLEDTELHVRHPKWIGAWWLGFLTFGTGACLLAPPLLCFPPNLAPSAASTASTAPGVVGRSSSPSQHKDSVFRRLIHFGRGFLGALRRLITNPVYMCTVLSTCSQFFVSAGGGAFVFKYIENQFSFPAWKANIYVAGMTLVMGALSTFVGGYLTKRLKMGPLVSLKFIIAMQMVATSVHGLQIAYECPQPFLHNSPGPRSSPYTSLAGCADSCVCNDQDYFPVCAPDGRSFFSPCHAGCTAAVKGGFINCTCIAGGTAVAGTCDYSCDMFYPFLVGLCLYTVVNSLTLIPTVIVILRSAGERDKALAMGFNSFLTSVIGWMLGPICVGKLIDTVCIQWGDSECTGGGACRLYDNDILRWSFFGLLAAVRGLGVVFLVLAFLSARLTGRFERKEASLAQSDHGLSVIAT